MELVSPRKKMAMGKMPAKGKRVIMDNNKGKDMDGSMTNLNRRSKRVSTPTRRTMVTSHNTMNPKAIGQSMIMKGMKMTKEHFMKFVG